MERAIGIEPTSEAWGCENKDVKRTRPKLSLDEVLSEEKARKAFDLLLREKCYRQQLWQSIQLAVDGYSLTGLDWLAVDGMTRNEVAAFKDAKRTAASTFNYYPDTLFTGRDKPRWMADPYNTGRLQNSALKHSWIMRLG
jgi:hypothetical protein